MNKPAAIAVAGSALLVLAACQPPPDVDSKESAATEQQRSQYAASQPIPVFDWSLERDMVIQLYGVRNAKAATHSVWRSDLGAIEGDCPSMGFGIPYDTSLTNPLAIDENYFKDRLGVGYNRSEGVVEQPEPNGIFASKSTAATWVMCVGDVGQLEPVYVETKVTTYPYPVAVDYDSDRVTKAGKATVTVKVGGQGQ